MRVPWQFVCLLCAIPALATEPGAAGADSVAVPAPAERAVGTIWDFLTDLFGLSTGNVEDKLVRIAVVFVIAIIAKLVLALVQTVSRWAVYSEWGPLKHLFRDHQRSITVHALLISLAKYVVYCIAFGYILSEFGIDYKTYLASLSLIGIAIGFGSQGLVQDVVTGFFILFENQFSVGDMVEISGQAGIVETIGLRTTRIRNYFGASVVLQNRNIPMAIRYPMGSFEAVVDVAIATVDDTERATASLQRLGSEMARQFQDIILGQPRVEGPLSLDTGERFVRLRLRIWPAQQWVIDGQLIPRIRELFAAQQIPMPADRIVAFYHVPPLPT